MNIGIQEAADTEVPSTPSNVIDRGFLESLITAITDNSGRTSDRYTVWFGDGSYITMSDTPWMPNAVSQWGDGKHFSPSAAKGTRLVPLADLCMSLQLHILERVRDGYRDYICGLPQASVSELRAAILTNYRSLSASAH